LYLAARETESGVDDALGWLLEQGEALSVAAVETFLAAQEPISQNTEIVIAEIDAGLYDRLLDGGQRSSGEFETSPGPASELDANGLTMSAFNTGEGN
jgi:hypothetical protein